MGLGAYETRFPEPGRAYPTQLRRPILSDSNTLGLHHLYICAMEKIPQSEDVKTQSTAELAASLPCAMYVPSASGRHELQFSRLTAVGGSSRGTPAHAATFLTAP